MTGVSFETDELKHLVEDLGKVSSRAVPAIAAVVKKGAQNVKADMVSDAESDGHYQHFSRTITYEIQVGRPGSIEYEIGPDKQRRQGALGNLLYFGGARSGPVLDIDTPLKKEEPRFIAALAAAAGRSIL